MGWRLTCLHRIYNLVVGSASLGRGSSIFFPPRNKFNFFADPDEREGKQRYLWVREMGQQEWNRDSCLPPVAWRGSAGPRMERNTKETKPIKPTTLIALVFLRGNSRRHLYDDFRGFYEALRQFAIRPVLYESHGLHVGLWRCICMASTCAWVRVECSRSIVQDGLMRAEIANTWASFRWAHTQD